MAIVEPQPRVLEDSDAALIAGSTTPPAADDQGEMVDYATLLSGDEKTTPAKAGEQPAPKAGEQPAKAADEEIPEEYRGKTPAQLAKMLKDSQSLIGRQGSELGELRRKVDFAIQASLEAVRQKKEPPAQPAAPVVEEFDDSEIFAKPKEAVSKLIENHPLIKEIKASLGTSAAAAEAQRAQANTDRFNASHPDAGEIMRDPEFRQWVSASRVRQALLQRAHTKFDFDAGDEVFSTWKALKGVKQSAAGTGEQPAAAAPAAGATGDVSAAARTLAAAKAAKAAAAASASAAAVPSGSAASGGKSGGAKKVYRRADIIRLMEEDPDRYEAMSDEITAAYREGRVR